MELPDDHPQFVTATIYKWKHLLKPDKYKQVIVNSMRHLVMEGRVWIYSFCVMSNHIHLIWQVREGEETDKVQLSFMKFTAQTIKYDLMEHHLRVLPHFEVNLKDRKYQFWRRRPLHVPLYTHEVFMQKLDYIHNNPVKAGLCQLPEEYEWSSASFYLCGDTRFDFLRHYGG